MNPIEWNNAADTICAVSTPPGRGGIAVVRVSGSAAMDIVQRCWQGMPVGDMASHTAHLGNVMDRDSEILDQAVLTVFRAPASYTGEDVIELACHGSVWIQRQVVQVLIDAGCRHAAPGEFTRRAFANGRMDLSQAEAVADVIAAQSRAAHHVAMSQMRGHYSSRLGELRAQLLRFVSLIELELDFSEEDVTFADRSQVTALAHEIHAAVSRLADSYSAGNVIKSGIPVAIVGQTNAGKSTLLNALLGDERALVSDTHGTTRDTIEDTVVIGGLLLRFIDTAGLRQSTDKVEQMGIQRSWQAIDKAALVLWVIDSTRPQELQDIAPGIIDRCRSKRMIAVFNKADLAVAAQAQGGLTALLPQGTPAIEICAKHNSDVEALRRLIVTTAALPDVGQDAVIVTNARHYQALTRAREAIARAIDGLDSGLSADLLDQDIRGCLHWLGQITGEITTDDILGEIFANFCVGK